MLIIHGIHGLPELEPSIFDYGELAIGLGTFILGIAVFRATIYASRKDRKVHIADKRMEWVRSLRENVAELMEVLRTINLNLYSDHDPQSQEGENLDELEHNLRRCYLIKENISLLFPLEHDKGVALGKSIDEAYKIVNKKDIAKKKGWKAIEVVENQIYNLVDEIINEQLIKIAELDSDTPLI